MITNIAGLLIIFKKRTVLKIEPHFIKPADLVFSEGLGVQRMGKVNFEMCVWCDDVVFRTKENSQTFSTKKITIILKYLYTKII